MQGYAEALQLLLNAGALITDVDNTNRTALALAAGGGYADCVRVLLAAGAKITKEIPGNELCSETRGRTPLLLAAARGHLEVRTRERLLFANLLPILECDSFYCYVALLREVLSPPAAMSSPSVIVCAPYLSMMSMLSLCCAGGEGASCGRRVRASHRHRWLHSPAPGGPGMRACKQGNFIVYIDCQHCMSQYRVSGLYTRTSDIAGLSHDKQTAGPCRCCGSLDIMTCVQDSHERIVRKLLKQGALPDALNRQGRTAAELAEANGHFRVIATLEASRAQVGLSPTPCARPW